METWPVGTGGLTLDQWQQDTTGLGGDRHAIIVKPGAGLIWETWLAKLAGGAWQASNGAKFDRSVTGTSALTVSRKSYAGPGAVTFGDATQDGRPLTSPSPPHTP